MTPSGQKGPAVSSSSKLPRRDWVLLPLTALLTIGLIAAAAEWLAEITLPEIIAGRTTCFRDDPSMGRRAIPNSVCWIKEPEESRLHEYRFNNCRHRAGMECGPKRPGTYRIVMVGSSYAFGSSVSREESFAARLPAEIFRLTGRRVDLYNEGVPWTSPHDVVVRFKEAAAAEPDLILWVLTPYDIGLEAPDSNQDTSAVSPEPAVNEGESRRPLDRIKAAVNANPTLAAVLEHWHKDRVNLLLRHFLYKSQSQYLKSFLLGSMHTQAGFLNANLDGEWSGYLRVFDADANEFESLAKAAGVPVVVVLAPDRAQAAMISMGAWPAKYNPYKLDDELDAIITRHGGIYIHILPGFRNIPNPERFFLPVDGHPNAEGHAVIASLLAKQLVSGAVPGLQGTPSPRVRSDSSR